MERPANQNTQIWLNLGLSKSQATVYLSLSKLGQAKARDIRRVAQVARQDIYRILDELVELGIVERVIKNPFEFRALPMAESVEILLQCIEKDKEKRIFKLRQETAQFVKENINNDVTNCFSLESEFSLSEGEASLLKLRKAVEQSQLTVELIINEFIVFKDNAYFEEALDEALHRGVRVRFLVQRNNESTACGEAEKIFQRSGRMTIRTISRQGLPSFEIFDGLEAAFVALQKVHMSPDSCGDRPAVLWTNNPVFVSTMQEYFENVWQQANDLT